MKTYKPQAVDRWLSIRLDLLGNMVVYCATLFAMKQSFGTYIPVHLKQFLVLLFGAVSFVLMEVSLKMDSLLLKSDFKHSMIYGIQMFCILMNYITHS
jgi:hypothetical protein